MPTPRPLGNPAKSEVEFQGPGPRAGSLPDRLDFGQSEDDLVFVTSRGVSFLAGWHPLNCKVLIRWSGRRGSIPRRPAWETRPWIENTDYSVYGVFLKR
jgi:hypothetical protein